MLKRFCFAAAVFFIAVSTFAASGEKTRKVAFVYRAPGIPFGVKLMEGFKAAVEERGGECILRVPDEPTAEAQIAIVKELVKSGVDAIGISANPSPALETVLTQARRDGVKIISADLPAAPGARDLHVSPVNSELIGRTLIRGAFEMAGESGELAILSSFSKSANQSLWIDWMKRELSRPRYKNFKLVKTVFGDDDPVKAARQTEILLEDFPTLKVIVSPTTIGLISAAKVLEKRKLQDKVLLTGLGFPSEMAPYIANGVCPWFYLWNPEDIGYLTGQAAMALADRAITGTLGEYFVAGKLGTYSVVQAGDSGTEVKLGAPFRFDKDTIEKWKGVY